MTPQQYKATLDALGRPRVLKVCKRQHQRYLGGDSAIPGPAEQLLTLLLDIKTNDDPEYYQQALKIIGG